MLKQGDYADPDHRTCMHTAFVSATIHSHASHPVFRPTVRSIIRSRQAVAARPQQAAEQWRAGFAAKEEHRLRIARSRVLDIREDVMRSARGVQVSQRGQERDRAGEQLVGSRVDECCVYRF